MSGILSWVLILVGLSVLLLLVYYFRAPEKATNKIHRAIPFVIAVLAIWSLITSWMWFYLFNLVLSMPTLLLAIVLNCFSCVELLNESSRCNTHKTYIYRFYVCFLRLKPFIIGFVKMNLIFV